jgi:hypothetical protein
MNLLRHLALWLIMLLGLALPAHAQTIAQTTPQTSPASQTPAKAEAPKADVLKADAAKKDEKKEETKDATPARKAPKAAIITLGERGDKDMVGLYLTVHQLKEILPMLKEDLGTDGTGIVVFRVTSGGGALLEIQRLSDEIHTEYKKHFKVVAWIDSAISAAAMTSHAIEEIYFTPQGNYGACTGWFGNLTAVKGRELEEVLFQMTKISARGGYDPKIMRAMQIMDPLSATIDKDGNVTYYQDEKSGEILLNPEGRILTFTSDVAQQVKFSKGTADTLDELRQAMRYQEIDWVGKPTKGFLWPISKAEKWSMDYREGVYKADTQFQANVAKFNMQLEAAAGAPREDRPKFVNRARQTLNLLKRGVDDNPNFALFRMNMMPDQFYEWYKEREKELRDLLR